MRSIVVISPSGNFYGSEQVLCDYLTSTSLRTQVIVNRHGRFCRELKARGVRASVFGSVLSLYVRLALACAAGKIGSVYVNEAGHSRYVQLLAKLFRSVRFVIHVRILEDTRTGRWAKKTSNLEIVTISRFIQRRLEPGSRMIYDPYPFSALAPARQVERKEVYSVGVIGRVSFSKGIGNIIQLLEHIRENGCEAKFRFLFFGDQMPGFAASAEASKLKEFSNVWMIGFAADKNEMYRLIDCVVHGAEDEPLGRVFLEAIDQAIPFIGVNHGGIGEIASLAGLESLMVDRSQVGRELFERLLWVAEHHDMARDRMLHAKAKALQVFNLNDYTRQLDHLLGENIN